MKISSAPSLPTKISLASLGSPRLSFGNVEPSGFHIAFQADSEERIRFIKNVSLATHTFAERVNLELDRLSPYYQAVGLWANDERRSYVLAKRLGIADEDFKELLAKHNHLTPHVFKELAQIADQQNVELAEVVGLFKNLKTIQPKPYARQRMLMMRTLMNSTPVIVADLLEGKSSGTYGFGDLTKTQVFNGKAQIGDLSISATASPRLFKQEGQKDSGYVFRFCVGKCLFDGFEEDYPLYMLDNKIVQNLMAWHEKTFPEKTLSENPLLQSMTYLLMIPTHDWGHSWLLYDLAARTKEFQNWGNDIYSVDHLNANKLLINYEVTTASMHNYTWRMLFDANPSLKQSISTELEAYHAYAKDFSQFVSNTHGVERAFQEENYLMYVVLSTLPCVLDRREPVLARLRSEYPIVTEQTDRILGGFFELLSSNQDGVPSKSKAGALVGTGEYIAGYPLQEELEARLLAERRQALLSTGGSINAEYFHAFRQLPESIVKQFPKEISDPTILPTLVTLLKNYQEATQALPDAELIYQRLVENIVVAESGHLFLRINRQDFDYDQLQICLQDKRVLLVKVPAGESVELRARVKTSLKDEVTKQRTTATDQDLVAFNVQSQEHAQIVLDAGSGLGGVAKISAMMEVSKRLAELASIEGVQDIYPLRQSVAKELYSFQEDGYYESLNRERLACATVGPVEMELHDGSIQKTLDGAFVYLENHHLVNSRNRDRNPDMHAIEQNSFDETYLASAHSLVPFQLRSHSKFSVDSNAEIVTKAVHLVLAKLREINLQIDHGESSSLAQGLFNIQ